MRKYLGTCFSLLFALTALPADAQPTAERRYLVEIIIFKNVGPDSSDGELWDRGFALPPASPGGMTEPPAPDALAHTLADAPAGTGELPAVQPAELTHMVDILSRLESSRRYEVLFRHAWTQPLRDKSDAISVPVGLTPALTANVDTAMLYAPPGPVTGTVKMFEQRLLFIEADVAVSIPTALASDPDSLVNPVDIEYRINETRRVKLNEVHYFDHPYFGLLVRVSRAEPARPESQPPPLTDEAAPAARTPVPPTAAPPN